MNTSRPVKVSSTLVCMLVVVVSSGCTTSSINGQSGGVQLPGFASRKAELLSETQKTNIQIGLARTMEQQGEPERAEMLYRNILEQHGDQPEAMHRLAVVCDQQMRFDESEELFRRALQLEPENQALLGDFGYSLYRQQQWSEAEEIIRKTLRKNPRDKRAHNHLGLLLAQTGRRDDALMEFRKAGCEESQAHSNLMTVLELNGHSVEAQRESALASDARSRFPQSFASVSETADPEADESVSTLFSEYSEADSLPDGPSMAPGIVTLSYSPQN